MGVGNLRVDSGTNKLMRADFSYNVPRGSLTCATTRAPPTAPLPSNSHPINARFGNTKYTWDVRLNRDIPLDVRVHFGAGE